MQKKAPAIAGAGAGERDKASSWYRLRRREPGLQALLESRHFLGESACPRPGSNKIYTPGQVSKTVPVDVVGARTHLRTMRRQQLPGHVVQLQGYRLLTGRRDLYSQCVPEQGAHNGRPVAGSPIDGDNIGIGGESAYIDSFYPIEDMAGELTCPIVVIGVRMRPGAALRVYCSRLLKVTSVGASFQQKVGHETFIASLPV